ncbi:MAG TPA: phosphoribosylamine--glycine ligase [Planctomycetaceae bacterium]|nr:phosphoribosylamine--glycine ligase [Planctomycetaceae bacterium]
MKVLVIGQGGREHALCWKLKNSPSVERVFCAPGNAGTALEGTNVPIGATEVEKLVQFAKSERIDLTVVGPEASLVAGVVDVFQAANLCIFGPTKKAAELEGSKIFSKELMRKANVPTAEFHTFSRHQDAVTYLEDREETPLVVKADGLAAGKGVFVCKNREEALSAVKRIMLEQAFGASGAKIVIEECLTGHEASILAIVDGNTILPLEASQDHKRAFDNDAGPNTGGMGAYSPTPIVTETLMDQLVEKVLVPTVHFMNVEERPFKGCLYAGIMITNQGPRVLEFNVRFGDPETQPVLMRLKSDLGLLLTAAADGKLAEFGPPEWDPRPAVCVVMAAEGYPGPVKKGSVIRGLDEAAAVADTKVFHAGTSFQNDNVVTDGGRVLGVTALGSDFAQAKLKAYQAVKCIRWQGAWCRKDVSDRARSYLTES